MSRNFADSLRQQFAEWAIQIHVSLHTLIGLFLHLLACLRIECPDCNAPFEWLVLIIVVDLLQEGALACVLGESLIFATGWPWSRECPRCLVISCGISTQAPLMTMIGRLLAVVVSAILDERFGSSWTRLEEVNLLCEVRGRYIFLQLCLLGV